MARLVLYHFSDLHFHRRDDFDRQIVINALWADIARQMEAGLVPDLIAVTGDIAFSGKVDEYKRAETEFFLPLLEKTNSNREDIFMVPGNHDVDRDILLDINSDRIAFLRDRDSINTFIGQRQSLSRYLASFEAIQEIRSGLMWART
jgi:predicted MPP superfamily phosphohydrolase